VNVTGGGVGGGLTALGSSGWRLDRAARALHGHWRDDFSAIDCDRGLSTVLRLEGRHLHAPIGQASTEGPRPEMISRRRWVQP